MREREAKIMVNESFELPNLADAVAGASLGEVTDRVTEDVYYDTADLRLVRWGCTLRHRKGVGWTVKIPRRATGVVLDRVEAEFGGPAGEPPVRALNLVASLTRGAPVEEVARLSSRRTVQLLQVADEGAVAELTDDDVSGHSSDGREVSFREIEIELAEDADDRLLDQIVERLDAVGRSEERPVPKAVRVIGDAATRPPDVHEIPLPPKPTARQVIRSAISSSVAQLLLQLPAARLGVDPEGVHQARVAARRMNSDLKTFKPLLDAEWVAHLRGELRWLIDALGAVRDCDILGAKLREVAHRHPEVDPAAAERVLHQVELRRRSSRRRLLRCLGDDRATRLFDDLVDAATSPATRRRADRPASDVMAKLVRKHWRRLDRAIDALGPHPTAKELHAIRILAKRLRYATEAVTPAVGKPARKFAKQAAAIQDALGELNDAAVAQAWLHDVADQLDGPAAFAAGQMAQVLVSEAGTQDQTWRSAHRSMTRRTAWFT